MRSPKTCLGGYVLKTWLCNTVKRRWVMCICYKNNNSTPKNWVFIFFFFKFYVSVCILCMCVRLE